MEPLSPETYFSGAELEAARHIAAGDANGLEKVLTFKLINVNTAGESGITLLLFALSTHQHACLQTLLRWRANPNQVSAIGRDQFAQPVAMAAGYEDVEQVRLLLTHGGDPNSKFLGQPALLRAIEVLDWPMLHLLVEQRGINLNLTRPDGLTPILFLAYLNQFEQVVYLLDKGADFKKADESGGTVAFIVQSRDLDPAGEAHKWQQRVRHRLEQRGVVFPVPDPSVEWDKKRAAEEKLRQQWDRTPAGRTWNERVHQAEDDETDDDDGIALMQLRLEADEAYEHWRKLQAAKPDAAAPAHHPSPR